MGKQNLRVSISKESGALYVQALEGKQAGRVIAKVEKLLLVDVEPTCFGTTGKIKALWGAELLGDLDNKTLLGLSIGRPFVGPGQLLLA